MTILYLIYFFKKSTATQQNSFSWSIIKKLSRMKNNSVKITHARPTESAPFPIICQIWVTVLFRRNPSILNNIETRVLVFIFTLVLDDGYRSINVLIEAMRENVINMNRGRPRYEAEILLKANSPLSHLHTL